MVAGPAVSARRQERLRAPLFMSRCTTRELAYKYRPVFRGSEIVNSHLGKIATRRTARLEAEVSLLSFFDVAFQPRFLLKSLH